MSMPSLWRLLAAALLAAALLSALYFSVIAGALRREYGIARPFLRMLRQRRAIDQAEMCLAALFPDKTVTEVRVRTAAARLASVLAGLCFSASVLLIVVVS